MILAYMGHNVLTFWYKMSNCFHIPYVVLNGKVIPVMIQKCIINDRDISGTENYYWLYMYHVSVYLGSELSCRAEQVPFDIPGMYKKKQPMHIVCRRVTCALPTYNFIMCLLKKKISSYRRGTRVLEKNVDMNVCVGACTFACEF